LSTKFCGITRILGELFYPTYDYKEAMRSAPTPARFKVRTGLTRPGQGQRRGRLVHDQVRVMINGGEAARAAMFGNQRSAHAKHFIRSLRAKKIKPLVSEYAIYVEELRMATEIDTVGLKDGKVSLIELKNYSNGFTHSNGNLINMSTLVEWSNCPLHQAYLQLALERYIFVVQNPTVPMATCYVVQVTEEFTKYFKLPQQIIEASAELFERVAAYRVSQLRHD
jgi:hypothetical protein